MPPEEVSTDAVKVVLVSPLLLGDACLSVPAVRAMIATLGKDAVMVACLQSQTAFWKNEVSTVIDLGKRESYGGLQKAVKEVEYDLLVNLRDEEMRKYWGDEEKLFVYKKEHPKALGTLISFQNQRGLKHKVEKYLAVPQLFSIDIKQRAFYPQEKPFKKTGLLLAVPQSDYGSAYHTGLESLQELFVNQIDVSQPTLMSYAFSEEGFTSEKKEVLNLDKLTFDEISEVLLEIDFLISPERNLSHLASYLGVPTVTVFGPGNSFYTRPLGVFHHSVFTKVECQPCFMAKCLLDHRCLKKVSKSQLQEAVYSLLKEHF